MYCIENLSGMLCVADKDNFFSRFFKTVVQAAAALKAKSKNNSVRINLGLTFFIV